MTNTPPQIADLVRTFRTHLPEYMSPKTNEAEIRQKFIDPFWRALGWDVGDSKGAGPSKADVIIEKSVTTINSHGLSCCLH